MNRLLLLLPVGLVALGVLEAADEPKKADPLKPAAVVKPETRWEHASISTGGRANVHLVTSTEDVSADSWANLAEKLKLTPNGTAYQVAVFDDLGGKGVGVGDPLRDRHRQPTGQQRLHVQEAGEVRVAIG